MSTIEVSTEELVARAAGLREQLHAESDAAEERGGYSPEMHQAFVDAGFYRMLHGYMYQPPQRCAIIEGTSLEVLGRDDFDVFMRYEFMNDDQDTWIVDGVRASDSATRRLAIKMHGPVKTERRRMSPIWDYQKADVMGLLEREKVKLPKEYEWIGRSFDAIRWDTMIHIAKHAPEDYETIKYWFPLIDVGLMKGRYPS